MTLAVREPTIPESLLSRWDARWKLAALLLACVAFSLVTHPATTSVAFGLSFGPD